MTKRSATTSFFRLRLAAGILAALAVSSLAVNAAPEAGAEAGANDPHVVGQEPAQEVIEITLIEALSRVRARNPLLLFNDEGVRIALEQAFRQRSFLLPSVTLDASQDRRRSARGAMGVTEPFRSDSFDLKFNARVPLIDTQAYADYRIARLEHRVRQREFVAVEQDFLEQTAVLYFQHLRDVERIKLSESNIERDRQLLQLAKDQFEAGAATRIDITRAEVRIARGERQLIGNRNAAENTLLRLKALLDIPAEQPVRTVNLWLEPEASVEPDFARLEGMRHQIFNRPELEVRSLATEQARLARRAADWQRLPDVSLVGNAGWEGRRAFDSDQRRGWLIGIRASIPIFEGFRIAADRRLADANIRGNELLMRDLQNGLSREYAETFGDVRSNYEQIALSRKEVNLAEDELELARQRFREGVADNRELIDAQQRIAEAEDGLLDAIFFYGLSRVALARAVGDVEDLVRR